jgi:membrane protein implicated in regulation of membrane protease activity
VKAFLKYLLFQLPGWTLSFIVLFLLVSQEILPPWSAGFLVLWILKDLVLFPWVRSAYENSARTGAEMLVGLTAVTQETLSPTGYVKINGELWRAQAHPAGETIPQKTCVRVRGAHGLILVVENVMGETAHTN